MVKQPFAPCPLPCLKQVSGLSFLALLELYLVCLPELSVKLQDCILSLLNPDWKFSQEYENPA